MTGGNTCYGVVFHSFKKGNGDPNEEQYFYTSTSATGAYSYYNCWDLEFPGC